MITFGVTEAKSGAASRSNEAERSQRQQRQRSTCERAVSAQAPRIPEGGGEVKRGPKIGVGILLIVFPYGSFISTL